ncbi:MAG TPA: hypothetical protein PKH92_11435 [Anaerolineaceae bacterium]|nr:hypothetical protein [Anaerolineaceae bacterium]
MPQIKIATFNTEWMILLFGGQWNKWQSPNMPKKFAGGRVGYNPNAPAITDTTALARRLAYVIREMNAQIIGLQEAPPLKAQLEVFVKRFLDDEYVVYHSNSDWQSISSLVHRSVADKVGAWTPALPGMGDMWKKIPYYPWGAIAADQRDLHTMKRKPLMLTFTPGFGKSLHLMVVHTKSKISKLTAAKWARRDPKAVAEALDARMTLSAEVMRIRLFLDKLLDSSAAPLPVMVMGDMNDGPYAETLENEFMIHNILDELCGTMLYPDYHFRHAMQPATLRTASSTRFEDALNQGNIIEELIDHMVVSPSIWQGTGHFRIVPNSCQVESAIWQAACADQGPDDKREYRPSDHKPVSVTVEWD